MREIIVKLMVEVLGIFAILTKEIKQGRASEPPSDSSSPLADRNPEKYLKKLLGRTDIEDALGRLDKLTQEEARMAIAEVLKVAHHVDEEVNTVSENVKNVYQKVNVAIDGTLSILAAQAWP